MIKLIWCMKTLIFLNVIFYPIGFQKLGVAVAFINFNLKMHPLVHSVLATDPKYFIIGSGECLGFCGREK